MMYPRLRIARNLLRQDGLIFISIDDNESVNFQLIMNEIFGEENFIGKIVWKGATDNNPTQIAIEHEYIFCYSRSKEDISSVWKTPNSKTKKLMLEEYRRLKKLLGDNFEEIQANFRIFIRNNSDSLNPLTHYNSVDNKGIYTGSRKVHNPSAGGYKYDVVHPLTGKVCTPPVNGYRYPEERMRQLLKDGKILFGGNERQIIQIKEYLEDYLEKLSSVIHLDSRASYFEMNKLFPNDRDIFTSPKPSSLLQKIFAFCLNDEDIAVDFFADSGTTAQAIIELNQEDNSKRRFLLIQLPEKLLKERILTNGNVLRNIADITKERIHKVLLREREKYTGKPLLPDNSQDLGRICKL